jgi:hypothetical protein
MKPTQKTKKKQKPTKSATTTTFSYINKTQFSKMKKTREKKIQESAKEDRSRLPATVRILFPISRVCAGGFANTRDAQAREDAHARTRTQTRSSVARCVATVVSGLGFPLVSDLLTYPTYLLTFLPTYLSDFFSYLLLTSNKPTIIGPV